MKKIYLEQLDIGRKLPSKAECLSYLCSTLRSLLQSLALTAIEVALQSTPTIDDDLGLKQYLDRFAQPSDGLPVEILDHLVPPIRSLVFRGYMGEWYERPDSPDIALHLALTEWVEFRNKNPGHGVLDSPLTELWAQKTGDLIQRILEREADALPQLMISGLTAHIGDLTIPITTPLVVKEHALVIRKVVSRKGYWKVHGQYLSWTDAREVTIDLGSSNIFSLENQVGERFKLVDIPTTTPCPSVYHNVPIRQTSTFVGRKKELDKLTTWLNDVVDSRSCLVYGDGGFGKTTLVLEFFNRLLEGRIEGCIHLPSIICFYTSKKTRWTEEGLIQFKGISDAMEDSVRDLMYCFDQVLDKDWYKVDGRALVDKAASKLVSEGFNRNDVLLIIDNTETLATSALDTEELGEFLVQVSKKIGRVIITSRRWELVGADPVPVSKLSDLEALQLIKKLGQEYGAVAIKQAGEATLRSACQQLMLKPLLIDTLVRYNARSGSSIRDGLDHILRKTNDELLEFLYEDAWERMNTLVREVFMVLVSLASPLDGKCIGDVCREIGVQHAEFQSSLGETYFASIVDYGNSYDLEIVELAKEFFRQKKKRALREDAGRFEKIAFQVDKLATERHEIEKNYRMDRVADAYRSDYAKAAKIAAIKRQNGPATDAFELALLEEPLNAALRERYASFLLRNLGSAPLALPHAKRSTELDPHGADAWLTLGLIRYQLGELDDGDMAMDKAVTFGKEDSLCSLRKAIARYHTVRLEPYSRNALILLKEADAYAERSLRSGSPKSFYFRKNRDEAEKYRALIQSLRLQIGRREVSARNAPKGP